MMEKELYTVTTNTTHFVEAFDATEALNIVYEALLGNDKTECLGSGEVDLLTMRVEKGYHSTIKDENYGR